MADPVFTSKVVKDRRGQAVTDGEGKPVRIWGFLGRGGKLYATKAKAIASHGLPGFHSPASSANVLARAARRARRNPR